MILLSRQLESSLAANVSVSLPKLTIRSDPDQWKRHDQRVKIIANDATGADVIVRRLSKPNVMHPRLKRRERTASDLHIKEAVSIVKSVMRDRILQRITTTWVVRSLRIVGDRMLPPILRITHAALVVPTIPPHQIAEVVIPPHLNAEVVPTTLQTKIVASRTRIREEDSLTKSAKATATCQTSARKSATHTLPSDTSSILEEIGVGSVGIAGVVEVNRLVLVTSLPLRDPSGLTSLWTTSATEVVKQGEAEASNTQLLVATVADTTEQAPLKFNRENKCFASVEFELEN